MIKRLVSNHSEQEMFDQMFTYTDSLFYCILISLIPWVHRIQTTIQLFKMFSNFLNIIK
jgi:hypothetical protein